MLRIWNLGRALDLLASSLPSDFQALSTDVSQASIQSIRIDESYSTTVTLPSVWATAHPQSAQERNIPIQIIDNHDGTASSSTWTTSLFSRSRAQDSSSTELLGTTTRTSYLTSTRSVQVTASLQETTLTSWTRSTTIWPDSATSWSPSPTPSPTSLEWDWWKGTKWQKTIAAEKKVRSAAVKLKVEMSGWKKAENDISPWVITFGVVLLALILTVMYVSLPLDIFVY
ncbi:hypothetical protein E6O75_ATG09724 [Venturia nashicola]|uniref:Uncharacterized protein n=1 Tax=Venturia nashicola TaxID=86259 RepID=A0A4Z1P7A3_9PEZI|nr:hypothetical protein E6O75_ATG09724 [Venturia nashicola]